MPDGADAPPPNGAPDAHAAAAPESEEALRELRSLLLAPEQQALAELHHRLALLQEKADLLERISERLPEAISLSAAQDDRLARALAPTVEETLRRSVERDPGPLADALFPVIGPAIRRSIREALRSFLESVNRTLEHSLSPRSFGWRLEAWRSGASFAEIVLSHTLRYRVEQIFLIDRETGLPLFHVSAQDTATQDSALVSSMLTALQDFARDSFGAGAQDTLDTFEMGDLTVWIEPGPQALVAAVIRGLPDPDLRDVLRDLNETIHLQFRHEMSSFEGDPAAFESAAPLLENGLLAQYREGEKPGLSSPLLWGVGVLLLLALGLWLFFSVRESRRWNAYLAALNAEPGLVVVETGQVEGRRFVRGLRDPLAADPSAFLAAADLLPTDIVTRWEPYQALDSALIVRRAAQMLAAPEAVRFIWEAGTLRAEGTASPDWRAQAGQRAPFLSGVLAYDDSALGNIAEQRFQQIQESIEAQLLRFEGGAAQLVPGQDEVLGALVTSIEELLETARAAGETARLQILGHASREGTQNANLRVSRERAGTVRQALIARGLPPAALEAVGTGQPHREGDDEATRALNRSVSIRVVIVDE